MRCGHFRHLLRRALRDDGAAARAAFRTHVDDPVGVANDVQIVLDDEDRIAEAYQPLQHLQQLAHIVEVQASGRLVQQVERASGLALAQFFRQLHALRFAAAERRGGLAQVDVAEADIDQRLQLLLDVRQVAEHMVSASAMGRSSTSAML